MNQPAFFAAVIDANVLYAAPVRDYHLNLAEAGIFMPKWTNTIHKEWIRSLLYNRSDLNQKQLLNIKNAMNKAFPDANVSGYSRFMKGLNLPDPYDHHVLAAAIKAQAKYIITNNLKDFPKKKLNVFSITAIHPDDFITKMVKSHQQTALNAFQLQVKDLKNPPLSINDVLAKFQKLKLTETVSILRTLL